MVILINAAGLLLIGFIIWWFWLYKTTNEQVAHGSIITIEVADGLYTPDTIRSKAGELLQLRFLRKDPSPCAATVLFSDFDISSELPIDKPHDISFTPDKTGEFEFTCQMAMYRGKLIVEE